MDQRARIQQDLTNIYETRQAMTSKLEQLEHRVQESVQHAKTSAREVVEHTQDAAQQLIDRLEDFMVDARQAIDPRYQMNRHPWLMLGMALASGYVVGTFESRQAGSGQIASRTVTAVPSGGLPPVVPPGSVDQRNIWTHLSGRAREELDLLKKAAFVMGQSLIHDIFTQVLPSLVAPLDPSRHQYARRPDRTSQSSGRYEGGSR